METFYTKCNMVNRCGASLSRMGPPSSKFKHGTIWARVILYMNGNCCWSKKELHSLRIFQHKLLQLLSQDPFHPCPAQRLLKLRLLLEAQSRQLVSVARSWRSSFSLFP